MREQQESQFQHSACARPPPNNVVRLAPRRPNAELIEYLRGALQDAERGLVIGFVGASHYGGDDYHLIGLGSLCDQPALGLAATHRLIKKFA